MFSQLREDIATIRDRDPASRSGFEAWALYNGLKAIRSHRRANWLYRHKLYFLARWESQACVRRTGIEIHPAATIGRRFFIDHGTGVVIGETAVVGDNVRIYQGVTLGAGNFPKDACGMLIKGLKRHPTVGSNVTIYSGASVLGNITIGDDSVVGGNVWLTESLPAGTKITARPPENLKKFRCGAKAKQ